MGYFLTETLAAYCEVQSIWVHYVFNIMMSIDVTTEFLKIIFFEQHGQCHSRGLRLIGFTLSKVTDKLCSI